MYFVRVFAYNRNGYSAPQIAAAPQKPMVIPSAPTGTTLQVVSSYQLKVISAEATTERSIKVEAHAPTRFIWLGGDNWVSGY